MHDTDEAQRTIAAIIYPNNNSSRQRRSIKQRVSPSPEPPVNEMLNSLIIQENDLLRQSSTSPPGIETKTTPVRSESLTTSDHPVISIVDQEVQLSKNPSSSSLTNGRKTSSTSDLDPFERKKQIALAKAQTKFEKAQRLYQAAQFSLEQNISEFLRVTTLPGLLNESKVTNAEFDKRIRTLQETKHELERKMAKYQSDLSRIQAGDIPHQYSSSKDILNNIKNKVSNSTGKHRSSNDVSGSSSNQESSTNNVVHLTEPEHSLSSSTGTTKSSASQSNFLSQSSTSHTLEQVRSSPSNSICNEVGNSQFYIHSNLDHVYDADKNPRRYEIITSDELSANQDYEKSPLTKRRLTDDSNNEFNDRVSDHSNDDRYVSFNASKRNTMTSQEHHQLLTKVDSMQKMLDRYETKTNEMQKLIESTNTNAESQRKLIERLNNEITDLTDLHQNEIALIKNDLKKLEVKLLYNFNEYWSEMIEKLEKLDTRTTKVEQHQTHSLETEESTHRLITKLVNILLTVFAIILLLLSTIKNLIQSRVHAFILLILIFTWIVINYVPDNPVLKFISEKMNN